MNLLTSLRWVPQVLTMAIRIVLCKRAPVTFSHSCVCHIPAPCYVCWQVCVKDARARHVTSSIVTAVTRFLA